MTTAQEDRVIDNMAFDVVVVVVVVTLGVSLPALLLRFLYYIQVGGVSNLAIETRSLIIMYKWSFRLLHFSLNVYFLCRMSI